MSLIARIGKQWHPLARMNALVTLVFILLELLIVSAILLVPTTISSDVVNAFRQIICVWWLFSFICLIWVSLNALWVGWRALQTRSINLQNVLLTWTAPVIIAVLWVILPDLLQGVTDLRTNHDFNNSRSDFLIVCERIYAQGSVSPSIGDNQQLGVYSQVDVRFRDDIVYFQLGDSRREYGYICVKEGVTLPDKDRIYDYEKVDNRFYRFEEIENLLTPQPDTPTPFTIPGSE